MEIFKPYTYISKRITDLTPIYTLNVSISIPFGYEIEENRHAVGDKEELTFTIKKSQYLSINAASNSLGVVPQTICKHFAFEYQDEFQLVLKVEIDHPTYFSLPLDFVYYLKCNGSIKKLIDIIKELQISGSSGLSRAIEEIKALPKNYIFDEKYLVNTIKIIDHQTVLPVAVEVRRENGTHDPTHRNNIWPQQIKYPIAKLKIDSKGDDSDIFD